MAAHEYAAGESACTCHSTGRRIRPPGFAAGDHDAYKCRAGVTPSPSAAQVRVEHDTRLRPLRQLRAAARAHSMGGLHWSQSTLAVHGPLAAGGSVRVHTPELAGPARCATRAVGRTPPPSACGTLQGGGGGTPLCQPPPSNLAVSARRALDTGGTAGAAQAARIRLLCPRRRRLLADGPHNNKKSVVSSTQGSQLVPLASTNQARPSLTSAFG